jgi:membrane protease YdiL (CAAX protease family)
MERICLLWIELIVVFGALPLLLYYRLVPNLPIPILLLMAIGAWIVLRHDPSFDRSRLFNMDAVAPHAARVLLRTAVLCALLGIGVWRFAPELLFSLVKRSPALWAAIMVLYPLLSVYPQELIFRAYFFHHYEPLFGGGWLIIAVSALAFGFVHIVFGNWLSVVLSTMGGVLFALTYQQSGSLLLASIEHALFGNFIFTIGLGQFFYHVRR